MGFAENVLQKIRGTPQFKPASIDAFGNWAIEAGDIISVENDGVTENIPIFSSDMNWAGSAQTAMSCTGNQKREVQNKQTRKQLATANYLSGFSKEKVDELAESFGVELRDTRSALDTYVKDTEDYKEANTRVIAQIKDGVSDVSAGMNAYVKRVQKKDENGNLVVDADGNPVYEEWSASAELFAKYDDVVAMIGTYIVEDEATGEKKSLVEILADLIQLQGDTKILGNFTVENGTIKVSGGVTSNGAVTGVSVFANGTGTQGIISGRRVSCTEFALNGTEYTPQQITSKSGTIRVLGVA